MNTLELQTSDQDIQVTATTPDEMQLSQDALIEWCKRKLDSMEREITELREAYKHAKKNKWKCDVLHRHSKLAAKRSDYYSKILGALQHGYHILPNFPISAFAIRTDKGSPLKKYGTSEWETKQQDAQNLRIGEGGYRNPFPEIWKREIQAKTDQKEAVNRYWAESWQDVEFPVQMAKINIMEATTNAMALKIFDEFGIMPQERRGDPMILARIYGPKIGYSRKTVTFIICWHLNTRDL